MSIQSRRASYFVPSETRGGINYGSRHARLRPGFGEAGAHGGMLLLRGMLQRIIRKGALTVIGPSGRSYVIGEGAPSVTIRVLDPAAIPQILLNPDLAFGEAYMAGALTVESGDIHDFLDLCYANLGWSSGPGVMRVRAAIRRFFRRISRP